ncbi:MAG TPA: class I SAM-dependent methyltransferase [Polyangia bacterium]|jgi:caffeoyl-CoA O-methyltransferase
MNKSFGNDDARLAEWLSTMYAPEDEILAEIRARSVAAGLPDIQVAALDARHLEVLTRASGVRRAVEVGTLGGYSGVSILRGLAPEGTLDTIEAEARHADVARESFRRAGFAARARVHVGLAMEVLPTLVPGGPYDLVFIDADKEGYPLYLSWAADNLRSGGVVLLDNAFLFGHLPEQPAGERAVAIRAMQAVHEMLARSGRFRATPLPTGEGLAMGVRI